MLLLTGILAVAAITVGAYLANSTYELVRAFVEVRRTREWVDKVERDTKRSNSIESIANSGRLWDVGRGAEISDLAIRKKVKDAESDTQEGFRGIDTDLNLMVTELIDLANVGKVIRGDGGVFLLGDMAHVEQEYIPILENTLRVYNGALDLGYRDEAEAAFRELPELTEVNLRESFRQSAEATDIATMGSARADYLSFAVPGENTTLEQQNRSPAQDASDGPRGAEREQGRLMGHEHQPKLGSVVPKGELAPGESSGIRGGMPRPGKRRGQGY